MSHATDGQYDLAGFPKPHVWWYVAKWLHAHAPSAAAPAAPSSQTASPSDAAADDEGTPLVTTPPIVRILSLLDHLVPILEPTRGSTSPHCELAVIGTNPPVTTVELHLDGAPVQPPSSAPQHTAAQQLSAAGDDPRTTQCSPSHAIQCPVPTDGVALCALQATMASTRPP
jgi:hypothetical protein